MTSRPFRLEYSDPHALRFGPPTYATQEAALAAAERLPRGTDWEIREKVTGKRDTVLVANGRAGVRAEDIEVPTALRYQVVELFEALKRSLAK